MLNNDNLSKLQHKMQGLADTRRFYSFHLLYLHI